MFHFPVCPGLLPLVLSMNTTENNLALSSFHSLFRYLYLLTRFSCAFSSPSWTELTLSNFSSYVRLSFSSSIFVDLLCTSNISMSLWYWSIQNWTDDSRCGLTCASQNGGMFPWPAASALPVAAQNIISHHCSKDTFLAHVHQVSTEAPRTLSSKLGAQGCSSMNARLETSPWWTSWSSCQPTSLLCHLSIVTLTWRFLVP